MSEHTPSTDEIRFRVEHDWEPYGDGSFDRWLAARDARIREEALRPVRALLDRVEHENFYAVPPLNHTSTKTIAIGIDRVRAVIDTPAQADGGEVV